MKPLYIIGTSGFAKEVGWLAARINAEQQRWSCIGYLSEKESEIGLTLPYGRVVGTDEMLDRQEEADVAIGIGRPQVRQRVASMLRSRSWLGTPNLIHPDVEIDPKRVRLGMGNIVAAGAIFTVDIVVGDFNVFNLNCTVGHDVCVDDYTVINPGCNISGGVKIGSAILIGTGVQILENLSIQSGATVGAGAVVVKSILKPGVYVGVPARPLE